MIAVTESSGYWLTLLLTAAPLYLTYKMYRAGKESDALAVNSAWLDHLQKRAMDLFDHQFVGTGPVAQQQPRRIAEAYQQLRRNLYGAKLREGLGLPVDPAHTAERKSARVIKSKGGKA